MSTTGEELLETLAARPLTPLQSRPGGPGGAHPWPAPDWEHGDAPEGVDLDAFLDEAFDADGPIARSFAVVVVHHGRIVAERYGGELEHFDRPPDKVTPETGLLSWSVSKSVLHSAIGILVGQGALSLDGPAPVPAWSDPADPRHAISIGDMLEMRDGLDFNEDYVDARTSDVIEMLFGAGQQDVEAYAAARPARWKPGEAFSYSSGTSNVLAGILRRTIGAGPVLKEWLEEHLFGPIGATSFMPTFDEAGTWVASSYLYASARDYARFGELQLRDGVWAGRRVLPEGWVDHGRRPRSVDPEDGSLYGAHWWVEGDEWGSFRASGYEGQAIVISPALDLVFVRLGKTPEDQTDPLVDWRRRLVRAFAEA